MTEIKEIKYTQKQMFEAVIKMANGEKTEIPKDKVIEFAEKKLEQLANKSGKTSAQKNEEQEAFMDIIRDVLVECTDVRGMRCSEIAKDNRVAEFSWKDGKATSPNRVLAYLKKMMVAEDVVRVQDKKDAYFHLA